MAERIKYIPEQFASAEIYSDYDDLLEELNDLANHNDYLKKILDEAKGNA
jgi:hypothetical protein